MLVFLFVSGVRGILYDGCSSFYFPGTLFNRQVRIRDLLRHGLGTCDVIRFADVGSNTVHGLLQGLDRFCVHVSVHQQ